MRRWVGLVIGLLPASPMKNRLLSRVGRGWRVHPTAAVGPVVLWEVDRLVIGPDVQISWGNVFRHLRLVQLDDRAALGNRNYFSGVSGQHLGAPEEAVAVLHLGVAAAMTNKHTVDAGGGVRLGDYSLVAGSHCNLLTHSLDIRTDQQATSPVVVGRHCFVGAGTMVLPGVELADRVVVGARSLVTRSLLDSDTMYAGSPARAVKGVAGAAFFQRGTTRSTEPSETPISPDTTR